MNEALLENLLNRIKETLVSDPINDPLVGIQISVNPQLPVGISRNDLKSCKKYIDKDVIISVEDAMEKLVERYHQEMEIEENPSQEINEVLKVLYNIKKNFFDIVDDLQKSMARNLKNNKIYRFIEEFKNGLLEDKNTFCGSFALACHALARPLETSHVSIDRFIKETDGLIRNIKQLLQSFCSNFSFDTPKMPITQLNTSIYKDTIPDYLCLGGRGAALNPKIPVYSIVGYNGTVQIRNEADDLLVYSYKLEVEESNPYNCVSWSPNGAFLAFGSSKKRTIQIMKYITKEITKKINCTEGPEDNELWRICWLNDSEIVAGFRYSEIIIYHAHSGKQLKKKKFLNDFGCESLAISPHFHKNTILVGSVKGNLYCLNFNLDEIWTKESWQKDRITMISLNKNGKKAVTASSDNTIKLLLVKKGTPVYQKNFNDKVFEVIWGENQQYIVVQLESTQRLAFLVADTGEILFYHTEGINPYKGLVPCRNNSNVIITTKVAPQRLMTNIVRITLNLEDIKQT